MSHAEFDTALIGAAFEEATRKGWTMVTVAGAARAAGLSLADARARFPAREAILLRLGQHADRAALADPLPEGSPREQLFDLLMRRFDALQPYRAGIGALMRALPMEPATALMLADGTRRSMGWMLEAAGIPIAGARGAARVTGAVALWLYAARTWLSDDSPDLAATMAALDRGLDRAERAAGWLERGSGESGPKPFPEVPPPPAPDDGHGLATPGEAA